MRWFLLCLVLFAVPAYAVQPDEILSDAKLEQRARDLSMGFRCLVCQNQSIDESDAPLAKDLRILIREHLIKGDSDAEIRDFVVARYGEFVLLKPRLTAQHRHSLGNPFSDYPYGFCCHPATAQDFGRSGRISPECGRAKGPAGYVIKQERTST